MASASGHSVAPPCAAPVAPLLDMAEEGAEESFTNPLEPLSELPNEPGA